jgi:hypothetical protein
MADLAQATLDIPAAPMIIEMRNAIEIQTAIEFVLIIRLDDLKLGFAAVNQKLTLT